MHEITLLKRGKIMLIISFRHQAPFTCLPENSLCHVLKVDPLVRRICCLTIGFNAFLPYYHATSPINDNIIIIILYLDVVLTETSGQNLDFLENIILILKEKIQNGFSDDENLIFVHILHRHTSKIFAIIVYVMLMKKVVHSRVMCLDTWCMNNSSFSLHSVN